MPLHTDQDSYDIGHAYGVGAYPKLNKDDAALIAFGMTNITLIEQAEKDLSDILPECNKGEVMRGFSVGLMTAAKAVGKMVA